jgi:penicillin amidase
MKVLRKVALVVLVVLMALALAVSGGAYFFLNRTFPKVSGTLQVAGLQERVEILRDKWGVPHIFAQNEHDVFFAQGYAHAQDRLWQLEFNRRVGAGRLSEVLGEATLKSDRFLRTIGLYRAAQADLAILPAETLAALQAYADGVNAFIDTHRDRLPLEFTLLGFKPEPWTPTDTLAWGKVMCMDLGGNWEDELLRAQLVAAFGEEKARQLIPPYPDQGPSIIPQEARSYGRLDTSLLEAYADVKALLSAEGEGLGSNNWVVDGTKTASGRPMLANDPHLGIQMPSIWYEVHLSTPEMDVVGASFPGAPGVIIGHNRSIAWGVTNVGPDVQDLYVEKVNPANPNQYEFRGQWEDMTVLQEQIKVKGRSDPVLMTVRLTRHGPLMTPVISGETDPVALRWTALEAGRLFHAVYLLDRSRNWEEFRAALKHWQAPSQNFVFADTKGNIGYQTPGSIPIRSRGQGLVPSPGWTGEYEWKGYIPFEELPSVYNPPTHFVTTANNKVVPDAYPYFIAYDWAPPWRAQRITELLQSKDKLTPDDFRDIQADTYDIPAATLMPYLLALTPQGWLQERAMPVMQQWDLHDDAQSSGAAIFQVMLWRMLINTFGDELQKAGVKDWEGSVMALLGLLPDGGNAWFDDVATSQTETRDEILQRSFQEALDWWGNKYGDMPHLWQWGQVHTATFAHPIGSVKPLNLVFNRGPVAANGSGAAVLATGYTYKDFSVVALPSYRQIIDVGEWANSRSMHTTGQSGQPFAKHYGDMIQSWKNVQHHSMLYEKTDIEANLEGKLELLPK